MPDYSIKSIRDLPDWRTVLAQDIDIIATGVAASGVTTYILSYTVPAGKTLFIYDWSCVMINSDAGIRGSLENYTTTTILTMGGGLRGFQTPLTKPKRLSAGQNVRIFVQQDTGVDRIVGCHIGGILW